MADSRFETQFKMCPSDLKCLKHHPCPFHDGKDCTIDDRAHLQRSVQTINNTMGKKREWSFAETINHG